MSQNPHEPQGGMPPPQGNAPQPGQWGQQPQPGQWGQPQQQGQWGQQPQPGQWGQPQQQSQWGQAPAYGQQGGIPEWQSHYGQGAYSGDPSRTGQAWPRLGARLLDGLILAVPVMTILTIPLMMLVNAGNSKAQAETALLYFVLALYVVCPIIVWAYHGYFGGVKGATPGKQILGMAVVRSDNGQPLGFWRYIGREIILNLACLVVIGYFTIFFDNSGQLRGWHDQAVNSRVIKR